MAYGPAAFAFGILEIVEVSVLRDREQFHIDRLNVCNRNVGYNLRPSATCKTVSEETKQLMSLSSKGKPKTERHRRRIAEARAKQDPRSLSHPHTQETKDLIRALAKARPVPLERGLKISAALTGRKRGPMSAETKAKISTKAKERGRLSDAHRKALSDASNRIRGHYSAEHGAAISAGKKRANALRRAASANS
jgi:hypothetical protein